MAAKPKSSSSPIGPVILAVILIAGASYLSQFLRHGGTDEHPAPDDGPAESNGYTRLRDCRLASWGGNDGDSFKIRHADGEHVFRLYFVDTPEKSMRFPDRVGYQARYFGISPKDAVRVGAMAKEFTTDLLRRRGFVVWTKWEPVMKSDRMHAFVVFTGDDGSGTYLCEELVGRGLARIYTLPADLPDGRSKGKFKSHLKEVESRARREKRGAWGIVGR